MHNVWTGTISKIFMIIVTNVMRSTCTARPAPASSVYLVKMMLISLMGSALPAGWLWSSADNARERLDLSIVLYAKMGIFSVKELALNAVSLSHTAICALIIIVANFVLRAISQMAVYANLAT